MNLDLFKVSDDIYALSDLKNDIFFHKIPKEKIKYYLVAAKNVGSTVADTHKRLYEPNLFTNLLRDKNISVNEIDKEYTGKKNSFRPEVHFYKREINVMKKTIERLCVELGDKFNYELIYNLYVAHEVFHFIEHEKRVKTCQILDQIEIFKLGPFKKLSTVEKTCDIAAHFYCKELFKLDFHPKTLDFVYMIEQKFITEDQLVKYFKELNDILKSIA